MNKQAEELAHELWATAQLLPNEGIEDGVSRIVAVLAPHLAGEQRLFETKLLGFEDEWRIRLCEACERRAMEDNFVVQSCALPLPTAPPEGEQS